VQETSFIVRTLIKGRGRMYFDLVLTPDAQQLYFTDRYLEQVSYFLGSSEVLVDFLPNV